MATRDLLSKRNVLAWLLMILSLAIHVLDEATTGFLRFYNDIVIALRERFGFFPAPTFSFELWLSGLIVVILVCFALTIAVARGGKVIRWAVAAAGVIMILNALGHLIGSVYFGRILPGAYSSPLLLLSSIYLVVRCIRDNWQPTEKGASRRHLTMR
jgi:hypothetical protein